MRTLIRSLRDAWRGFWGRLDDRYIRREEVLGLMGQMSDAEIQLSQMYDKLNMLAARLSKRDQRKKERAAEEPPSNPPGANPTRLDVLRRNLFLQRAGDAIGRSFPQIPNDVPQDGGDDE